MADQAGKLFEGVDFERKLTGTEIRDFLVNGVREQVEQCALLADELAERLSRSGKDDQAMVAIELAAKIRARILT